MKIHNSNQYCLDILGLDVRHGKALANLVMALSSSMSKSVVGLSLSPLYHYQYSSICDVLSDMAKDEEQYLDILEQILSLLGHYLPSERGAKIVLQTDTTSIIKGYSPTLASRGYVPTPNNCVPGNKPVDVGYRYSLVNKSMSGGWSVPLSIKRVKAEQSAISLSISQLEDLFENKSVGFDGHLVVNTADSYYSRASYLAPTHTNESLVSVVRLGGGRIVYSQRAEPNATGRPGVYGDEYCLCKETRLYTTKRKDKIYSKEQISISEFAHDDYQEYPATLKNGRAVIIKIFRWNDLLIRSSQGHSMKDKPLDVLCVRVFSDDQEQKQIFKKEMYLCISGKRKFEIQTIEGQQAYRTRWDIEPSIRFGKRELLLNAYQTPDLQHLDNWMLVVQLAYGLLYSASDEVAHTCHKWQKYNEVEKQAKQQPRLTASQTKKAIEPLLSTFDKTPFLPQRSIKGKGRRKGQKQTPRATHLVVKKAKKDKKDTKIKLKTEKLE